VTEKECADRLLAIYKEEGAEGFSFPPIVSFGSHGADPHHMPDDTKLSENETVLFDIGCRKNHYCSDMTRTVAVGKPAPEMERVYQVVLEAQHGGAEKGTYPGTGGGRAGGIPGAAGNPAG